MRVDAYRNLTAGCISVRSCESENRGLVIDHVDEVIIRDAVFAVGEKSRDRVRREQKKNVHAVVRGERADEMVVDESTGVEVTYNPYQYDEFVIVETEEEVFEAEWAVVRPSGVVARLVA